MERREFLIALAGGLGSILASGNALARIPLRYALTSTPDKGTTLDNKNAEKARKLAEYVITRVKHPELVSYTAHVTRGTRHYQGVQVEMIVDARRYIVFVANHDEDAKIERDMITFWIKTGTKRQERQVNISDRGLDGRCDFGIGEGRSFNVDRAEGPEHREYFQGIYVETLDKLIRFYEKK